MSISDNNLAKKTIKIVVKSIPVAQPRVRVTKWGAFNPVKDKANWARIQIAEQFNEKLECPIEIKFIFYMKIPKSTSKKIREAIQRGEIFHTKKPDIDNLIVFILNSMTDIVYHDDSQVYKLCSEKRYSENPRTEIFVTWQKLNPTKNLESG